MKTYPGVHLKIPKLIFKKNLNSNNSLKLSSIRKLLKPFSKTKQKCLTSPVKCTTHGA